jgi:hypothetical protein
MHSLFTPVDTLDGSNFLRAVHSTDGSLTVENFLMPVDSFQQSDQPTTVNGYGKTYSLYLTVEATLVGTTFETLTSQLWLDPRNNDGAATVSDKSDPSFTNGIRGDILLATGTMESATLGTAPNGIRTADFVETMTPTPAGQLFLGGSIKDGSLLEENLTTDTANPSVFGTFTEPNGTSVNTVTGGQSEITLKGSDNTLGTILLPSVPSDALHLTHGLKFIHG